MPLTPDKRNKLLAGGLVGVLAIVIYYQFIASDDPPPRSNAPQTIPVKNSATSGAPSPSPLVRLAQNRELPVITEPLPLELLKGRGKSDGGTNRNIFVFPTPTPVPTPAPTPTPVPIPPPPVVITSVNPAGKIARTADFELVVMGAKIPTDAKVFLNGQAYMSTVLSESQVKATIPALAISQSGNLRVEVKSASDPVMVSNALNLNVADPPIPPYLFVAIIVNNAGVPMAVMKSQADSRLVNVHKGDVLGKWKILDISVQKVDVLDTEYNIKHILGFTGEGG